MRMPGRRAVATSVCIALACVMMIGVAPPASAAAPTNDDPEDAAVISGLPFEVEEDTTDATVAPNEPNRCGMGNTI